MQLGKMTLVVVIIPSGASQSPGLALVGYQSSEGYYEEVGEDTVYHGQLKASYTLELKQVVEMKAGDGHSSRVE